MNKKENLKEYLLEQFEKNKKLFIDKSLSEIFEKRFEALNYFSENGFPTRKDEEWRFTNINPVLSNTYLLSGIENSEENEIKSINKNNIKEYLIKNLDVYLIVFINGILSENFSSFNQKTNSFYINSFSKAQKEKPELIKKFFGQSINPINDAFSAINTAFSTEGIFIYNDKNHFAEKPFHILNLYTDDKNIFTNTRNIIVADVGSDITIIESYHNITPPKRETKYLANSITEIFLLPNSQMQYYKIQNSDNSLYNIGTTQVIQKRDSVFKSVTVTLNGGFVRNNLNSILTGENSECILKGVYIGDENNLVDNHTLVDHAVPNCYSNEFYKGILAGSSHGVFNGKILVRKDAQKTNAYQSNKNILISDKATINAKPQLEIFADDVKCSHGATAGRLNANELFYLRSRGIERKDAERMLLFAFLSEVINSNENYSKSKNYLNVVDKCLIKKIKDRISSINL